MGNLNNKFKKEYHDRVNHNKISYKRNKQLKSQRDLRRNKKKRKKNKPDKTQIRI